MVVNSKESFSLLELVFVIIIIGILATLALSQYNRSKEYGLGKEAISNMRLIVVAEKIYHMERGHYYPDTPTWSEESDIGNINSALKLSLNTKNWDYSVYAGNDVPSAWAVVASRSWRPGSGTYGGCMYAIAPFIYGDEEPHSGGTGPCP